MQRSTTMTIFHVLRASCLFGVASIPACDCGDPLDETPKPIAVLVNGQQESPPEDNLVIGLPATLVNTSANARFAVRNDGNRALQVASVVLGADPLLCPQPSTSFQVVEPLLQPFTVEPGAEATIAVRFQPTSGQLGCTVAWVSSDDADSPQLKALITGQGDAPDLCLNEPFDDGIVDFGEVQVGGREQRTVTLRSCGTRPVTLQPAVLNDKFPPFEATTPPAAVTLAVDETIDVPVAFAPTAAGNYTVGTGGTVIFAGDDGISYGFVLIGSAREPPRCRLQVVPEVVQFGSVAVNLTTDQSVFVRNIGDLECTVTSMAVVGGAPFSRTLVDLSEPQVLPAQTGGTIRVTYAPTVVTGTADSDTLRILSNDPLAPQIDVPLQGTSVERTPCLLQASPTALNFGSRPLRRSQSELVTLTNIGDETCRIREINVTGSTEFTVIESTVAQLLGTFVVSGGSVEIIVIFRPESSGPKSGNVEFVHAELGFGNPTQYLNLPLTGSGDAPCISVTPSDIDFGVVAVNGTGTQSVQVANCGASDLDVRGLTLRSGTHPDFHIAAANLAAIPVTLLPGAGTTVTLTATPTAAGTSAGGGAMYGFLDVLSDAATSSVSLRANAQGCTAGLVCSPQALAFGDALLDEEMVRTVVCNNPTGQAIAIGPSIAAPFAVVSSPTSVPPGGQAIIRVRFRSTTAGSFSSTLEVGANSCSGGAVRVATTANANNEDLPACPQPQNFSPQLKWEWPNNSTPVQTSLMTWVTPLVARLNDTNGDGQLTRDDAPRVIFTSFNSGDFGIFNPSQVNDPIAANLRILDGATGADLITVTQESALLQSANNLAVIDLDGDGRLEIIGQKWVLLPGVEDIPGGPKVNGKFHHGNLIAFNADGTIKWISDEWVASTNELEDGGGVSVGDVDGDGRTELAYGDNLFNADGRLLWAGDHASRGSTGHGATSVLIDVDGVAGLELVAGPRVYRANGTILWDRFGSIGDGHPAVADLDGDGLVEVVIRNRELHVLNGQTGADLATAFVPPTQIQMPRECESPPPGGGGGGEQQDDPCNIIPTNVALIDVNGDGFTDIVSANEETIIAYDRNLNELFRQRIYDGTGAAGPAGFDFEGDGAQEVVYADEQNLMAFNGDGDQIYSAERSSVTIFEYGTIADIDLDGHADLIVGSNEPLIGSAQGVDAFENTGTSWAQARSMWNQHAYVEDLVSELGAPVYQDPPVANRGFRSARSRCIE